tara:strand:+ start:1281 stop:2102 length:822 start_codon:yes stop_codon:yes gene_type:complete
MHFSELNQKNNVRHVLGISGGKDSAALAIYIKDRYPEISEKMEYFFTDTGSELKEIYEFLDKLEAFLNAKIHRLSSGKPFEHWLKVHNDYLPSAKQRWCTRVMKIKPFEEFVGDDEVISYVGIRADENRGGYQSSKETIKPVFPFVEDGIMRGDVFNILEKSTGVPKYYDWRSRSGCYFCFFQRESEWLGLKRKHPKLFERAKAFEEDSGNGFTWRQGATLDEVVAKAEAKEAANGGNIIATDRSSKIQRWQDIIDNEIDEEDDDIGCLTCSL